MSRHPDRSNWRTERRLIDLPVQRSKQSQVLDRRSNDANDLSGPGAFAVIAVSRGERPLELAATAAAAAPASLSERMDEVDRLGTAQGEKKPKGLCVGHLILPIALVFAVALTGAVLSGQGGSAQNAADGVSSSSGDPCDVAVPSADPFVQCECSGTIGQVSPEVRKLRDSLVGSVLKYHVSSDTDIASCDPENVALVWTAISMSRDRLSLQRSDDLIDRFVLALAHASLGGRQWKKKSGWMSHSIPVCSWYGVECDRTGITALSLPDNNLNGLLHSSIGLLPALQRLVLYSNDIMGSIPDTVWGIPTLVEILLHENKFDGTLPSQISDYSPRLKRLSVADNALFGALPDLTGFTNLVELNLSRTMLEGTFPTESLEKLSSLEVLKLLYMSGLSGSLPSSVGLLTDLRELSVLATLSGTIPESIGNLTRLEVLEVQAVELRGSIPSTLGYLTNLGYLDLGKSLSGKIPTSLGLLTNLYYLNLKDNCLSGSMPTELAACLGLEHLYVGGNQMLGGTLPLEYENLLHLQDFDISCTQQIGGPALEGFCNRSATIMLDASQANKGLCSCCANDNYSCTDGKNNCTATN